MRPKALGGNNRCPKDPMLQAKRLDNPDLFECPDFRPGGPIDGHHAERYHRRQNLPTEQLF